MSQSYVKRMDVEKLLDELGRKKRKGRARHSIYTNDSEWRKFLKYCDEAEVSGSVLIEDFIRKFNEGIERRKKTT